jgi:phage shock protein PspC (stress-responsive transcriptional regulator)
MWIVWVVFVVFMAALYIYRSFLTKNEEDQIFLDDSFDKEKAEQEAIIARVAKVEPLVRVAWILVVAMSIMVIVYYVRDILLQFHVFGS